MPISGPLPLAASLARRAVRNKARPPLAFRVEINGTAGTIGELSPLPRKEFSRAACTFQLEAEGPKGWRIDPCCRNRHPFA